MLLYPRQPIRPITAFLADPQSLASTIAIWAKRAFAEALLISSFVFLLVEPCQHYYRGVSQSPL